MSAKRQERAWWTRTVKWLGVAGLVGVAAGGVLVVRNERQRQAYTSEEVRQRLRRRAAETGDMASRDASTSDPRTVRVQRLMPASPETVFALLASPARHAELAGSDQVLGPAEDSPARLSLGARFGMRTRQIGFTYVSANEVVEFEEGRRIAWKTWGVIRGQRRIGGHVWRFLLVPEDGGTGVTHEYEWWRAMSPRALQLLRYPQRSERHMHTTLERLERLTARDESRSG